MHKIYIVEVRAKQSFHHESQWVHVQVEASLQPHLPTDQDQAISGIAYVGDSRDKFGLAETGRDHWTLCSVQTPQEFVCDSYSERRISPAAYTQYAYA